MSKIRVGCQTYTWEMLGSEWQGKVTDILDWLAEAGYQGIEITSRMIGEFAERPKDLKAELDRRGLALAAFAYVAKSGYTDPDRWDEDLAGVRQGLAFLREFPEPILGLGGPSSPSHADARQKIDQAIRFYHAAGRLAVAEGARIRIHPNSHSLALSAEDYDYLFDRLDPSLAGFCPDTGHIVRGGQELLPCLRRHLARIIHVHLKDVTAAGEWVAMGEGSCDFPAVMALLESAGYTGWIIAEEESEAARRDGVGAIRKNRAYLRSIGF
ncbi:MAG TPA: TIM barrel protein [Chloroflexota bacterium]|nr:TIM barrel protein [Chloroflexota bacterium]